MKKVLLISTVLVAALISCNRTIVPSVIPIQDSTAIISTTASTKIDLPGTPDSAFIRAFLQCDSLGNIYLKTIAQLQGEVLSQSLKFDGRTLEVDAKSKIRIIKEVVTRDSIVDRKVEVPMPYPVKEVTNILTSWQSFQIWLGRLLLLSVVIYVLIKFAGLN